MTKEFFSIQPGLRLRVKRYAGEEILVTPIRWPPFVSSKIHEEERLKAIGCTDGQLGPVLAPTYNGQSSKSQFERAFRGKKFAEQEGKCFWCFKPMSMVPERVSEGGRLRHNGTYASLEHYIPKECGGSNKEENLVLAHANCNTQRKRRKFPHDPIYGPGQISKPSAYIASEQLSQSQHP